MTLFSKSVLDNAAIVELETFDHTLTKTLVKANQKLCPLSSVPWSPTVQKAYLLHWFWVLTHTEKCTHRTGSIGCNPKHASLNPTMINQDPNISLSTKLCRTPKPLKKAKCKADQLCQQHLDKLLNEVIAANHTKCSKHQRPE